jgi:hypothetical protein
MRAAPIVIGTHRTAQQDQAPGVGRIVGQPAAALAVDHLSLDAGRTQDRRHDAQGRFVAMLNDEDPSHACCRSRRPNEPPALTLPGGTRISLSWPMWIGDA